MAGNKKEHAKIKSKLHPRSKHRSRYDFEPLIAACPDLEPFVRVGQIIYTTWQMFCLEIILTCLKTKSLKITTFAVWMLG